ncbi:TPA: DNA-binding protein [Pasteurella multocida]|nr:DNA-binding protein [Pasteurella multocida]
MSDLIIYNTDDGKVRVSLFIAENDVWLSQTQLVELFDTSVQNIPKHIENIFEDKELDENSVINFYLKTA